MEEMEYEDRWASLMQQTLDNKGYHKVGVPLIIFKSIWSEEAYFDKRKWIISTISIIKMSFIIRTELISIHSIHFKPGY